MVVTTSLKSTNFAKICIARQHLVGGRFAAQSTAQAGPSSPAIRLRGDTSSVTHVYRRMDVRHEKSCSGKKMGPTWAAKGSRIIDNSVFRRSNRYQLIAPDHGAAGGVSWRYVAPQHASQRLEKEQKITFSRKSETRGQIKIRLATF